MRIFLISRGIPDENEPTWGSFEIDQACALKALGHEVVILSVDTRFRLMKRKIGITYREIDGIKTYNIFYFPFVLLGWMPLSQRVRVIEKLLNKVFKKAILEIGSPDILYTHYLFNSAAASRISRKYSIPQVAIEHDSKLDSIPFPEDIRNLATETYKSSKQVIAVSESLRNNIKKECGIDTVVINNLVSEEILEPGRMCKKGGDPEGDFNKVLFLSVGALIPRKNFEGLINAFAQLGLPGNLWSLDIVGSGPLKNSLEEKVRQLGLEDNINILGKKTKKELVEYFSKADVFILNSRSETFGVVLIEALAWGIPVIATKCGGPEEIVNETNGLLVKVDDDRSLGKAILTMMDENGKYDRNRIANDCRAKYSSEVIGKKIETVLIEALEKK